MGWLHNSGQEKNLLMTVDFPKLFRGQTAAAHAAQECAAATGTVQAWRTYVHDKLALPSRKERPLPPGLRSAPSCLPARRRRWGKARPQCAWRMHCHWPGRACKPGCQAFVRQARILQCFWRLAGLPRLLLPHQAGRQAGSLFYCQGPASAGSPPRGAHQLLSVTLISCAAPAEHNTLVLKAIDDTEQSSELTSC